MAPHRQPIRKGWRWHLRHSLWLLATLPFGLTTWAGFLYIGLRANRRSWLWTGAGYAVGAIVLIGLILAIPEDAQGEPMTGTWQDIAAMVLTLTMWIGGIIHGLVVNIGWLRWRANPPETPRPF